MDHVHRDGNMEVDMDVATAFSSGVKRSSTFPPTFPVEKRPKLALPQVQLTALNDRMRYISQVRRWQSDIDSPKDNTAELELFSDVLRDLTGELMTTELASVIRHPSKFQADEIVKSFNEEEFKEWKDGVVKCMKEGNWSDLLNHPKLRKPTESKLSGGHWKTELSAFNTRELTKAYNVQFMGDFASDFVKCLNAMDNNDRMHAKPLYAKAISVVQSSGTGKSRMLTEVGKLVFTLPICLRHPSDPGYPPSDEKVFKYFHDLPTDNDLNITAHHGTACFLAAAHITMLEWLKREQKDKNFNARQLLTYWHGVVEPKEMRDGREMFFSEVVQLANSLKAQPGTIPQTKIKSPRRNANGDIDPPDAPMTDIKGIYSDRAKKATEDLMTFLSTLFPNESPLCVTYFDEAHELDLCFGIMLRLLCNQLVQTRMWYVFMGTKSSISYYAPIPGKRLSLRLRTEMAELVPPYVALGFDQKAIAMSGVVVNTSIGDLQTIEHLSKYGRPLWNAQLPEQKPGDMVALASLKLRNGEKFNSEDKNHVFAVLSQRLCIDPVLVTTEADKLTDWSVSHHMRLLTGFSPNYDKSYTSSPSEPILTLGAVDILYKTAKVNLWPKVLTTFSKDLCSAGLVEKGILGELGVRILLILVRDFAAPIVNGVPNLLKPVRLLDVLHTLFGNNTWAGPDQQKFDDAFADTYVNFTHWSITRDPLPEVVDPKLLANLWARGAALQCSFNQESIDFLIPTYSGSVNANAIFDPAKLSGCPGQVKASSDGKAEIAIRPIGILHDDFQPLPYLAILLELGNKANYNDHSKIQCMTPKPAVDGQFERLRVDWNAAANDLENLRIRPNANKKDIGALKAVVMEKRQAMDFCNRFSISVRGISPEVYGILNKANIASEFATFLSVTLPSPSTNQDKTIQEMRPLDRLGPTSGHTAWMSDYVSR